MSDAAAGRIRIGVSACLLGEPVRYDGQLKRDDYIADTLGSQFELVSVCPEIELGMSTPREAIDLVGDPGSPGLIAQETGRDWTDEIASRSNSEVAGLIGNVAILYRRHPDKEKRKIELPKK